MRYGAAKVFADDDPSFLNSFLIILLLFSALMGSIAASHTDGMVRIWDVRTGQLMRRVKAHMDSVTCIAFMPDGKGFVSGGWDKTLKYWDISSLDATRFRARSLTRNDLQDMFQ
jgi:WD40 repeat protein